MRVRSWVIRGLILAGVAALAALAWYAHSWISPERVREQVVATLSDQFEGVDVHVGSARMRILGGIAVTDLKLTRRGAAEPFVIVPSAILYHDKEQLNHGRLVIRKVEMDGPTLRLERSAEGKWNVTEVSKPGPADKPVPTFVIKNGTVIVVDRTPGALPPATFTDVQCTLLNDPLSTLTVQATASAKGYGPLTVRGRLNRVNGNLSLSVDLAQIALGEAVVPVAKRFAPELAPHLAKIAATASVKAELIYTPEATPQWRHKVRFEVKDARFEHPELPWPVEKITAAVSSEDGHIKVEDATAEIGRAKVRLSLETRADVTPVANSGPASDPLRRIEDNLKKLDISAAGVALDDALFERLPDKVKAARKTFAPTGQVDLGYRFTREGAGWRRELEVRPKQSAMVYEKFRYPISDIRGLVKRTVTHAGAESTTINLVGTAAGQLVTIEGRVEGDGPDPAVALRITGQNVPIDESLFAAFPAKYAATVRELRAAGRLDFVAKITQPGGVNLSTNEFIIDLKEGKLNYTAFPYALEKVKGRLVIRSTSTDATRPVRPGEPVRPLPDRDELVFDSFTGVHAGAPLWMHGARRPHANGRDRKIVLHVGGNNLPLDAELKTALAVAKVDDIWTTLAPKGNLTFAADVEVLERVGSGVRPDPDFDPANDIRLTFSFSGPTITPKFFAYELTDVSGWLEYKNNRLDVAHFAARHGVSRVKLAAGDIRFYPDGAVWANLGGIEMKPLIPDAALKKALPGKLGPALEELQLKGGAELFVKHLVVSAPPEAKDLPTPPAPLCTGTRN